MTSLRRRQRYVVVGVHLVPAASPHSIHETEDILNGYEAKGYRVVHVFSGSFLLLEWDVYRDRIQVERISGIADTDLKTYMEGIDSLQRFNPDRAGDFKWSDGRPVDPQVDVEEGLQD